MSPLRDVWQHLREYDNLARISEIARRYFAMNAFDGVLTIIGVLMGNMTAKVDEARIVLTSTIPVSVKLPAWQW